MSIMLPRRRFTVDEYYRLAEVGILTEDDRVELIEGEIIEMAPIGHRHAFSVAEITDLFVRRFSDSCLLWAQNPLELRDVQSVLQPDVALLRRATLSKDRVPTAADVALLVEVADSTLAKDRRVKLPLYATVGVPEYWIINLRDRVVERYADPDGDAFRVEARLGEEETIAPHAFPDVVLDVRALLG